MCIPHMSKTELWPPLQTVPPTVFLISTLFRSQSSESCWLFFYFNAPSLNPTGFILKTSSECKFLPISAAGFLVWPSLIWLSQQPANWSPSVHTGPCSPFPTQQPEDLWKYKLDPITLLLEILQWLFKSCSIKSKFVIENHVFSCQQLSDLIFLSHYSGLHNNP